MSDRTKMILTFLASFSFILLALFWTVNAKASCPDLSRHEIDADCPWADAARALAQNSDPEQFREILDQKIPGFMTRFDRDGRSEELLDLWGLSKNIDASNIASGLLTIPASTLQFFTSIWNVPYDSDFTVGHAGLNHTYGYLFSNVTTPYGFKRSRYVQGEIESGFGITSGMFSGLPAQGTLLSNLSQFAGTIAFRDSPSALHHLKRAKKFGDITAVPELAHYPYSKLKIKRLLEIINRDDFYLELRTDIVDFPQTNIMGSDAALLIYSMIYYQKDSSDFWDEPSQSFPRLITIFPVQKSFAAGIFNPSNFGDSVSISLKYNAAIPEPIPAEQMVGKRLIANESKQHSN